MAQQRGTRDNPNVSPESLASVLGRAISFVLLAGVALAIVAGVALLPAYARLNQITAERDRLDAANTHDLDRIDAQDHMIEALPEDRILAKRLAMRHFGAIPRNEHVVAATEDLRAPQAGTVDIEPPRRPEPVTNWMTTTARRIANSRAHQILILLAIATLAAAVILSNAPRPKPKPAPAPSRSKQK